MGEGPRNAMCPTRTRTVNPEQTVAELRTLQERVAELQRRVRADQAGTEVYTTMDLAARAYGAQLGVKLRGGYVCTPEGARLAHGWTAYAAMLLHKGALLRTGEGYRIARKCETCPTLIKVGRFCPSCRRRKSELNRKAQREQ